MEHQLGGGASAGGLCFITDPGVTGEQKLNIRPTLNVSLFDDINECLNSSNGANNITDLSD